MAKRFHNTDDVEKFVMANCAMILSRAESRGSSEPGKIFKCKTCQRTFSSFHALGGHTASHKRLKLDGRDKEVERQLQKPYKCTVCSAEFQTGQILGGHMTKHRTPKIHDFFGTNESSHNNSSTCTSSDDCFDLDLKMVGSSCSGKRVLGLDLNLSPEENEFKIFGC